MVQALADIGGSSRVLSIIGCGNPNRTDDGAGVYVAGKLKERFPDSADLRIFIAGLAGMDVMFQARGSTSLIIIDANRSDSEPGSIFEVPGEVLANIPEPSFGLHGFRWDHALYAGKKIFKNEFPDEVTVFLIEAESLELGFNLTETVQRAADKVVEMIVARLVQ